MKRKYSALLKTEYLILIAVYLSIFSACNDNDDIVDVEKDNTIYVELNALADGFGNLDSIAQDEEILIITDFFQENDDLWGFMPLGISYFDSTLTSILAETLTNSLNNPTSHFRGPYTTQNVLQEWSLLSSTTRHSVYLIFVINHEPNKYFIHQCYKAIPRNGPWIELEIEYSDNSEI